MRKADQLACPSCQETHSKVYNCRRHWKRFYRWRECLACGTRYRTEEVIRTITRHGHKPL